MEKPRIPEMGNMDFGPQTVRPVDQAFVGIETPDIAAAKWVESQHTVDQLSELGAPAVIVNQANDKLLTNKRFQVASETIFTTPRTQWAFGELISRQARRNDALDDLVARLNPEPLLTPTQRFEKALFGEPKSTAEAEAYDFAQVFTDKTVSNDTKRELVRLHTDALRDASEELEKQLPSLREQFASVIRVAVDARLLPATAIPGEDEEERLQRLANLHIIVSDPVLNRTMDRDGHFDPIRNTIHIDANAVLRGGDYLREVFTHEMLHALSGFNVRLQHVEGMYEENENENENEPLDILDLYKEMDEAGYGFVFARVGRLGLRGCSHLLNEAYTEWANMQITGSGYDNNEFWADFLKGIPFDEVHKKYEKYGSVYFYERVVLAGLVSNGIDITDIGAAYFESYEPKLNDPKREIGKTQPASRRLDASVADKTPFRSLEQLTSYLEVASRKYEAKPQILRRLLQAHIVANDFSLPEEDYVL